MKKNIGVLCIFAVCTVFFTGCMSFNVKKKKSYIRKWIVRSVIPMPPSKKKLLSV